MPNDTLKQIITDIDEAAFHARYLRIPLGSRPDSCDLPPLVPSTQQLPVVSIPDISKDCVYNWIEEVLPVEPFVPPFPCPAGFEFVSKTVGIKPLPNWEAVTHVSVGMTKGQDENGGNDICRYLLNTPDDVVIPCYPAGPLFDSHAAITVRKGDTETTTDIKLNRDGSLPCKWSLDGTVTIDIPVLPCPDGLTFLTSSWQIKSTCSSVPAETKPVKISKTAGYDCIYSIDMPDITIPCYPDGPRVHGHSSVIVTDRGSVTSTQQLGFPTTQPSCCDFQLGGDIALEIPCQTGLVIPNKTFKIISTGPSVQPDTDKTLKLTKSNSDMCHYDFDFPDLQIPCYPNGPTVAGTVNVHIGRGHDAVPVQHIVIGHDPAATCKFDLTGDLVIPMPDYTINCPALDFHGGVRIRKSSTSPWITNTVSLDNEACGAVLSGDIDLGLPPFVSNCTGMSFGGSISVRAYQNGVPGNAFPSTVTLTNTPCGANISGEILLDIPTFNFPCSGGYTALNTGPVVRVNGQVQQHTLRVSKVTDPLNSPNGNQCAFALTGALDLNVAGGGGGGFTYVRNWRSGSAINAGTVVGIIGHEGGRCNYVALRNVGSNEPPPDNDGSTWSCLGCENGKRHTGFKVIQAAPPSWEIDQTRKDYVKVVFDSKLTDEKILRKIIGLNQPFNLPPGHMVYLEVTWNWPKDVAKPIFVSAAIAHGTAWDHAADFGSGAQEPSCWPKPYKFLAPSVFGAAFNPAPGLVSSYLFTELEKWAINKDFPLNAGVMAGLAASNPDLFAAYTDSLAALSSLFDDRNRAPNTGRPIKSYLLIAQAKATNNSASGDLVLTDGGGNRYAVQQVLNAHVFEAGVVNNGRPTIQLRGGGNPPDYGQLELSVPQNLAPGSTVAFTATVPASWPAGEPVPVVGLGSDDIHIYYSVGQTNEIVEPTYDDFRVSEVYHFDPATPTGLGDSLTRPTGASLYIRAIAYHPRLRCSAVVVGNYTT